MTAPLAVCVVGRLHRRSAAADGHRFDGLAEASLAVVVDGYDAETVRSALPGLVEDVHVPIETVDDDRYRLTSLSAGKAYWRRNLPEASWVIPDA